MLLGEYSVRTGKTPQHKSTYTINTRLCHRGSNPAPASSHPVPQPLFRRWSQTRLSGWRFKATEARDRGWGVLYLANCCEGCFLHQGKNSSVIHHSCFPWSSGSLVLLSSPVHSFFLRMFRTVVLATPNVFSISLMGLFCFFSLMMACFTDCDSSLDLILTVDSNRFRMQIAHLKWTLDLLSAHCNWDSEGITYTWPWNSWEANCPITFGPLTSGRHICKLL